MFKSVNVILVGQLRKCVINKLDSASARKGLVETSVIYVSQDIKTIQTAGRVDVVKKGVLPEFVILQENVLVWINFLAKHVTNVLLDSTNIQNVYVSYALYFKLFKLIFRCYVS